MSPSACDPRATGAMEVGVSARDEARAYLARRSLPGAIGSLLDLAPPYRGCPVRREPSHLVDPFDERVHLLARRPMDRAPGLQHASERLQPRPQFARAWATLEAAQLHTDRMAAVWFIGDERFVHVFACLAKSLLDACSVVRQERIMS